MLVASVGVDLMKITKVTEHSILLLHVDSVDEYLKPSIRKLHAC